MLLSPLVCRSHSLLSLFLLLLTTTSIPSYWEIPCATSLFRFSWIGNSLPISISFSFLFHLQNEVSFVNIGRRGFIWFGLLSISLCLNCAYATHHTRTSFCKKKYYYYTRRCVYSKISLHMNISLNFGNTLEGTGLQFFFDIWLISNFVRSSS